MKRYGNKERLKDMAKLQADGVGMRNKNFEKTYNQCWDLFDSKNVSRQKSYVSRTWFRENTDKFLDLKEEEFKKVDYIDDKSTSVDNEIIRQNQLYRGINIVNIAAYSSNCEVWVAGGKVRIGDNAVIGSIAASFIKNFKIDYAIVGISAIDEGGTLLDFDHEELLVSQAIYKQSRKIILIADANKFNRKAPYVAGNLSDVDIFVTDLRPSENILKICKKNNVRVIVTFPLSK